MHLDIIFVLLPIEDSFEEDAIGLTSFLTLLNSLAFKKHMLYENMLFSGSPEVSNYKSYKWLYPRVLKANVSKSLPSSLSFHKQYNFEK